MAEWFAGAARDHGGFDVELVDLAEAGLPLLDEPHHPRLQNYTQEHTKAWSATIARGDAYVFVTPEYNYGLPAPLKNAIDFLHVEWAHKPYGVVSYGGISAGTRAATMLRTVLSALALLPAQTYIAVPFVAKRIEDGVLTPNDVMRDSVPMLLDELLRLESASRTLRN